MNLCSRMALSLAVSMLSNAVLVAEQPAPPEKPTEGSLTARVEMKTTLGTIALELDGQKTPVTVQNFLQYVDEGFYTGTIFHRVISNFMIQGGGFTASVDQKSGVRDPILNEWQLGLKNERGTIAMARRGVPDSATAQFFINVVDNPGLDQRQRDGAAYTAFGRVVEGMEVVDKIRDAEVQIHPKYRSRTPVTPVTPIVIESVIITRDVDREALAARAKKSPERIRAMSGGPASEEASE